MVTQFSQAQGEQLVDTGAITVRERDRIQMVAVGAYQLSVCQQIADQMQKSGYHRQITYLIEPGRFRSPREPLERPPWQAWQVSTDFSLQVLS